MSDAPQGPGWWQASDDRWYPPEQAPGAADAATTPSGAGAGPTPGAPTGATGPPAITPPPGGWGTAPTSLDIGTALSFGWTRFTQHLGQIAILMAAIVVTMLIFSFGYPVPADYDGDGTDDPALFNHDNDDAAEGWQILGRPEVAVPGGAWPTVIRPWLVEHIIGLSYAEDVCSSAEPDPLCP